LTSIYHNYIISVLIHLLRLNKRTNNINKKPLNKINLFKVFITTIFHIVKILLKYKC